MSNDLVVNLDAFKQERVPDAELPVDESLAGGIGSAYAIVGYKGKTWSLRYRGENHLFKTKVKMDDGSITEQLARTIDVVILQAAPGKSKSYFPNWEDASGDPPLCASLDGIVPDAGVEQQQSETCAGCRRNEWKTLPNGRKGRECTDYKRLAVALMPNATKLMFGEPLMEPVFLRVPPASLNSLALLDQKMGARGLGYHYSSYLTRISFVEVDAKGQPMSYPQMVFYAVRPLTPAELAPIKDLRKDPQCQRITGETGTRGATRAIVAPTHNVAAFIPQKMTSKQIARLNTVETENDTIETVEMVPAEEDTDFGLPQGATQPLKATSVVQATTTVIQPTASAVAVSSLDEETGLGGTPATPASLSSEEAEQALGLPAGTVAATMADTGEPEESDEELDRRIAGLINKAK